MYLVTREGCSQPVCGDVKAAGEYDVKKTSNMVMSIFLEVAFVEYFILKVFANNKTIKLLQENVEEHICYPIFFKKG